MSQTRHESRRRDQDTSGVTQREAEVLRAIFRQSSNAEIATQLTISVRTVESHVSSLLTKYGVTNRAALIELVGVAAHGWIDEIEQPPFLARLSHSGNFVGRVLELKTLINDWGAVTSDKQRVLAVTGEAGIGKTRLASEFAAYALNDGGIVLYCRCDEERGGPLEPIISALRPYLRACPIDDLKRDLGDLIGELGMLDPYTASVFPRSGDDERLDANVVRFRLFEVIKRVLDGAAVRAPLVLVLDDLQWASAQTLRLLRYLVEEGYPRRTMFLCTYITTENNEALTNFLAVASRAGVHSSIELSGLQRFEVAQMLGHAGNLSLANDSLVLDIYRETQGNAFFTVELIRHVREGMRTGPMDAPLRVPSGVNDVVAQRVSRLSDTTQRVLRTASVLGQQFDILVLQHLVEIDDDALIDALEEAVASHLLDDVTDVVRSVNGEHFAFSHSIVRRSLLRGVSAPRRRRIHASAARAIEARYPESLEQHADEIAGHLVQAGQVTDQRDTFMYLTMAGRAALAGAAPEEALRMFERAAPLREHASLEELAELTFQRGMAQRAMGRWADAIESWSVSLDFAANLKDDTSISRTCRAASHNLVWALRPQEAVDLLTDVLGEMVPATVERASMLGALSFGQAWAGDYVGSTVSIAAEQELAERLDDTNLRAHALAMMAQQLPAFFEHGRAVTAGFQAAEILRAADDSWSLTSLLGFVKYALVGLGRIDEARAVGAELAPMAERIGNFASLQQHLRMDAMISFFRTGGVSELASFAIRDRDFGVAVGLGVVEHSHAWLGMARFLSGDWEEALGCLKAAAENEPLTAMTGWGVSSLLEVQAYTGDVRAAEETWLQNRSLVAQPGRTNTCGSWTMASIGAEALAVMGDFEQAHDLYPTINDCITRTGVVCIEYLGGRLLNRLAGVAAAAGGDWQAAEDHFASAMRESEDMPHVVERAHTLRLHGTMLLETGIKTERSRAIELLGRAEELYAAFGMPRFRESCHNRRSGDRLLHA